MPVNPPSWAPAVSQTKFFQPTPFSGSNPDETLSAFGWYQQWNGPSPANPVIQQSLFWEPFVPVAAATILFMGWMQSWQQAAEFETIPQDSNDAITLPSQPPLSITVTPTQLGFYEPWQGPQRAANAIAPALTWEPQVITTTVTALPYGWMQPWSSSRVSAASTMPTGNTWEPQPPPNLPVTPTQIGWYEPWSLPMAVATSRRPGGETITFIIPPTPPPPVVGAHYIPVFRRHRR